MSWLSGGCDPNEPPPMMFVVTRQNGPNGEPGKLIWRDTGSGPGREEWVSDEECPDFEWPDFGSDEPSTSSE